MAKKVLFALLFCGLLQVSSSSYAANLPLSTESTTLNIDQCDAPAPDSFRVTVASSTFVTLAWRPVWVGATQTLTLLVKENQSSSWIPVDTFFNVSGTSFTVPISQYDLSKVGFLISTNCNNGETGTDTKLTSPPIGFILDLTLGGLNPSNPTVVETCSFFSYSEDTWMGFAISANGAPASGTNTFQLKVQGDLVIIKKVLPAPLVVGDFNHHHPKDPAPEHILFADMPRRFLAYQITEENSFLNIGGMLVELAEAEKAIKVCKSPMPFWNNNYTLKVLIQPPPGNDSNFGENRFEEHTDKNYKFVVQTPFVASLNIFTPQSISNDQAAINIRCSLWNTRRQLVLEQSFDSFSNQISIPTETLLPGFYVLQIETVNEVHTFKVIKSGQ